jgi:beta-galactosidase
MLAALLLSGCANAAAPGPRSSAHATTLSRDASVGSIYAPPNTHRRVDSLDAQWKFFKGNAPGADSASFDDSVWTPVTLPHTWNAVDGQDGPQTPYYRGVGWYRKHFTIAPNLAGGKLYLQFDGANIITDVFVNGAPVGRHAGGFARFRFDITRMAAVGADNLVAVKVDNSPGLDSSGDILLPTGNVPPLSGDFTFFGGLYRGVYLLSTDPLAIDVMDFGSPGVYLKQTNVSSMSASLAVTAKLANSSASDKTATVRAVIVDANNRVVQVLSSSKSVPTNGRTDVVLSATIAKPHLWNGLVDPYSYRVFVEVGDGASVTDLVEQPLGLRSFALDPNTGFSLNGAYLDLHGVNMHQDARDHGWAVADADTDAKLALVKEIGATSLRLAHYQHSQHTYDMTDRMGLVVWAETAIVNRINSSTEFAANAKEQLTELIRQNYNHPSIVFWGIGNEVDHQPGPSPDALIASLAGLVPAEDPTRIPAYAADGKFQENPVNWHATACGFNEYWGWYKGVPDDFATWADGIHAAHGASAVSVTEYGAGANPQSHALPIVVRPGNQTPGEHTEEYQAFYHETYWNEMKKRPFLWGKHVWNMFDFASDGRKEGGAPGLNDKGLVTFDRQIKKDSFFWYKANWSTEAVVYISSRRFTNLPAATTDVRVYSNLDSVELSLNGATLGKQTGTDHIFIWHNVPWQTGPNVVTAIGGRGATTFRDVVTWTK